MLDIPDEVRRRVLADGSTAWLEQLPELAQSLARDWSLTLGGSLPGGVNAVVLEATTGKGQAAVLKMALPGLLRDLGFEATALQLASGEGCVRLLRQDMGRGALLLERLGGSLRDLVPDVPARHDLLCEAATRIWRPIAPDVTLPTGADKAIQYSEFLPVLWEQTGRPCSKQTIADALACAERRRQAHDDHTAVLVHGDIHDGNALQATNGTFALIDPVGLRAEPACDLGTIIRSNPDLGDDLRARTERLAARTGVDATAIWEWGTVHRVISGLFSYRIGFQPFGQQLLTEADRLTAMRE